MRRLDWRGVWAGIALLATLGALTAVLVISLGGDEPGPSPADEYKPCDGEIYVRIGSPCPTAVVAQQVELADEPAPEIAPTLPPPAAEPR